MQLPRQENICLTVNDEMQSWKIFELKYYFHFRLKERYIA